MQIKGSISGPVQQNRGSRNATIIAPESNLTLSWSGQLRPSFAHESIIYYQNSALLPMKGPLSCKQNLSPVNKSHAEFIYVYMIIYIVC